MLPHARHPALYNCDMARALLASLAFAGLAVAQQSVHFATQDGGVVFADLYGKGDRSVILAHGGRFDKASWKHQAQVLANERFRVLAIDFRGYGKSRGPDAKPASDEDLHFDVLAAVRYLRESGSRSVSVVGASMGGGAAAEAAVVAKPSEIERIVLLAHSPIDHPEKMQGRKLFIVSRDDLEASGVPRLVKIREQYAAAPGPKELVILDGSAHAQFIFETEQAQRLMHEIVRFLSAP
jgi:pimeloyl-ACP methyl ester carboxylesterase